MKNKKVIVFLIFLLIILLDYSNLFSFIDDVLRNLVIIICFIILCIFELKDFNKK